MCEFVLKMPSASPSAGYMLSGNMSLLLFLLAHCHWCWLFVIVNWQHVFTVTFKCPHPTSGQDMVLFLIYFSCLHTAWPFFLLKTNIDELN